MSLVATGGRPATSATKANTQAKSAKTRAPVVRCIGRSAGGVIVQVDPPTAGVAITLRPSTVKRVAKANTDIVGRAALSTRLAPAYLVSVETSTAKRFTLAACRPAAIVSGTMFVAISGTVKGTAPLTLGFGSGQLTVPGGSISNGVSVMVKRAPKSLVTGDPANPQTPTSLSEPVLIETDSPVAFALPMQLSFIVAAPPQAGTEVAVLFSPAVQPNFRSAAQATPQLLPAVQLDHVVSAQIPGPGTVEVVRIRKNNVTPPSTSFTLASIEGGQAEGVGVREFFTDTFSDPLDYSNPEDHALVNEGPTQGTPESSLSGGQLHLKFVEPGYFSPLWGGYNAAGNGREGNVRPIDGTRYRRLRVRMNASAAVGAGIFFYTCPFGVNDGCQTGIQFVTTPGWKIYEADVPATKVTGIRVAVSPSGQPVTVDVDWVQVLSTVPGNMRDDGVVVGPVPEVLNPDVAGAVPALFPSNGRPIPYEGDDPTVNLDWASLVRGDAWDFDAASDVAGVDNFKFWAVANGIFDGVGINGIDDAAPGDPGIRLALDGHKINPSLSHRITVHVPRWDGIYSQQFHQNGGWVFRALWKFKSAEKRFQVTNPLVEYPNLLSISADLADPNPFDGVASPLPGNNDSEATGQVGWIGKSVTVLRIDLAEPYRDRHEFLDDVWLGTDDWGVTSAEIAFRDVNPAPGTTAELFEAQSPTGPWTSIGTTPVIGGLNTYQWTNPAAGVHWIKIRMTRGVASGEAISTGPVAIGADLAEQVLAGS